jgi:hypothetical protein
LPHAAHVCSLPAASSCKVPAGHISHSPLGGVWRKPVGHGSVHHGGGWAGGDDGGGGVGGGGTGGGGEGPCLTMAATGALVSMLTTGMPVAFCRLVVVMFCTECWIVSAIVRLGVVSWIVTRTLPGVAKMRISFQPSGTSFAMDALNSSMFELKSSRLALSIVVNETTGRYVPPGGVGGGEGGGGEGGGGEGGGGEGGGGEGGG